MKRRRPVIPVSVRKAANLALATPKSDVCAACHASVSQEMEDEATPCCHHCAQELLWILARYVDCLRSGRYI